MKFLITALCLLLTIQYVSALRCYNCVNVQIGKERDCYSPGPSTQTTLYDDNGKICTYCTWSEFHKKDDCKFDFITL